MIKGVMHLSPPYPMIIYYSLNTGARTDEGVTIENANFDFKIILSFADLRFTLHQHFLISLFNKLPVFVCSFFAILTRSRSFVR